MCMKATEQPQLSSSSVHLSLETGSSLTWYWSNRLGWLAMNSGLCLSLPTQGWDPKQTTPSLLSLRHWTQVLGLARLVLFWQSYLPTFYGTNFPFICCRQLFILRKVKPAFTDLFRKPGLPKLSSQFLRFSYFKNFNLTNAYYVLDCVCKVLETGWVMAFWMFN